MPFARKSAERQALISKTFRFEAAHQLPNHDGQCRRLHGHSYLVQVRASGPIQPEHGGPAEGMVLDFADIKAAWQEVGAPLDHQFLNDMLPFVTTAENMAAWMLGELRERCPQVCAVRLWETATSWAEVSTCE